MKQAIPVSSVLMIAGALIFVALSLVLRMTRRRAKRNGISRGRLILLILCAAVFLVTAAACVSITVPVLLKT